MSSIDISQIPELLEAELYPVILNQYEAQETVYDRICDVQPYDPAKPYGEKMSTTTGLGRPMEVEDGEEIPADSEETAYTPQLKVRTFARRIDIPRRVLEAFSAAAMVDYVLEKTEEWGTKFALEKDDFVAGMFQKGTLTAGSAAYFDNSYPGNADPNPKFIYDGLPFFDTAHTLAASSSTLSNHTASAALTSTTLQNALILMETTSAKDDRGDRIRNRMDTMVVPGDLEFTARTILNSTLLPGSPNNDANVVAGRLNLIPWNALTDDTDAWWIGRAGAGVRVRDSGAPFLETVYDPKTRTLSVVAASYFGATVREWRAWHCANKAAS